MVKELPTPLKRTDPNEQIKTNTSKVYLFTKRLIDILLSILGLTFLLPLMILVAFLIKFEDPKGKVIFKQIRVGKCGKPFYMYKFRSMVADAEELKVLLLEKNESTGPIFKMKNDPRVTKIGKIIRKTSFDELPQLLNVLKGEMSLVGPRPPLPQEVEQYTTYQMQRLMVQPGLTCYWQVNGRSNIRFEEWVELDIEYIRNRNLWVDLKLILKTIFVLWGSKGAY
ncbi:sugar transferase [Lysinibacillus yapensis]|uniref:Sugar transferase n=1 Tax=Ureibacillus yapensis TaxID=2304605 RepID=A0A396SD30_9BACL|nr:sugar transferase [Lysinibacillus yapensis]RHW39530.1 sugar transferase [Lysinibacillus yapensis]